MITTLKVGLRVYPRHFRALGYCMIPGARDWFKHHGFNWRDFVKNGIDADRLLATNDAFGLKVVEQAKKEQDHGK